MDYKDTVMSDKQLAEVVLRECDCKIDVGDIDRTISDEQAKISWDAGIREVIEWIENNNTYSDRYDTISIDNRDWGDQLKQWGIKPSDDHTED